MFRRSTDFLLNAAVFVPVLEAKDPGREALPGRELRSHNPRLIYDTPKHNEEDHPTVYAPVYFLT